jgi:cytoskeletal protein CcmA (bactofilin family)
MWEKKDPRDTRAPEPPPSRSSFETVARPHSEAGGLVNIGPSIFIKGELSGDEDLTIEGRVEGKIELKSHNLTIGPKGKISAQLHANAVIIRGEVTGNVFARERVEIADTGRLSGDITSPRIVISDGAQFRGSVDMSKGGESSSRDRHRSSGVSSFVPEVGEPVGASARK